MTGRYAFLDVYRGVIVLLMVEGHVVRETLLPTLQQSDVFRMHELLHGVIGPGFLFGAGITFGISVQRHWNEFLFLSPRCSRRLRKILLLFVLGYSLHLPFFSLSKMLTATDTAGWISFFNFDVLQCIGLSLLLLHVVLLIVRKERFFVLSMLVLLAVVVYGAPILWRPGATGGIPEFFAAALQGTTGSIYPLFPYGGFLFAGGLVSYEFMKFAAQGRDRVFVLRLAIAGAGIIIAAFALDALPVHTYAPYDFWLVSPNFFLMKLGSLFLLVAGIWVLEHRAFEEQFSTKQGWLVLFGVESLFVYVAHLILLYGSAFSTDSVSSMWSGSMAWGPSLGLSLAVLLLLYGLTVVWNKAKTDHAILFRGVVWCIAGGMIAEFLTRPY